MERGLLLFVLLMTGTSSAAQQIPSAGGQLQQIPPAPVAPKSTPDLGLQRPESTTPASSPGPKVPVQSLHVTGQSLFSENELVKVAGFKPGTELDLADLRRLAANITDYYNRHGFFLAQAYVPAQDIRGGMVTLTVIEGRYGKLALNNQTNLRDRTANGVLGGLESGEVVATAPLERRLLLLSDIQGVGVRSTLSPGTAVGSSDLLVDIVPGRRVTGSVEADNAGNRYTGAVRAGGTINVNDLAGIGDVLSLRVLTSFTGFAYGRASYQALLGQTTIGVAYSHINYRLGREFRSLDASGTADVASLYASYPLIRQRDNNLALLGGVDVKWFDDKLGYIPSDSHRRTQVGSIGLTGDEHDAFGGGGWSTYSAAVSFGNLDIRDPADRAFDAATARSNGGYGKLQMSAARLQTISGPLSVFGSVRGQVAFNNLDISEKIELGGAYAVRAYPEGEAYGDEGYVATAEARLQLNRFTPRLAGRFQLFAFIDVGEVNYAKDAWFTGSDHAARSGYGGGLSWAAPAGFFLKATYAHKLGSAVATSAPDHAGRAWFQISKTF